MRENILLEEGVHCNLMLMYDYFSKIVRASLMRENVLLEEGRVDCNLMLIYDYFSKIVCTSLMRENVLLREGGDLFGGGGFEYLTLLSYLTAVIVDKTSATTSRDTLVYIYFSFTVHRCVVHSLLFLLLDYSRLFLTILNC